MSVSLIEEVKNDYVAEDWTNESPDEALKRKTELLNDLELKQTRVLPAEAALGAKLGRMVRDASSGVKQARFAQKHKMPIMSLAPLAWTNELKGFQLPKLALVPLHEEEAYFSIYRSDNFDHQARFDSGKMSSYPPAVKEIYKPVIEAMKGKARTRETLELSWRYQAAIPDDTKMIVADLANERVFEGMYMLAEAKPEEWKISRRRDPRPPRQWLDPLILGWAADAMWLVDAFDPTPLELYVASEFASRLQLEAGRK